MEKYEILLNEIKKYLNKEEINVNTNNEIISLYNLTKILMEELEGLKNIKTDSKINKKLNSFFMTRFSDSFFSEINGDENTCTICIKATEHYEPWSESEVLRIHKDKGIDEIYLSEEQTCFNKKIFKFVKKNYNLILETLQTLEDYVELLGNLDNSYCETTEFRDSLFKVKVAIKNNGIINYEISILDNHELFEEYNKKWYKREGIYEFVDKNVADIFKRIPVSPYELDEPFKSICFKHKEKENAKVKTLKMHQ